MFAMPWGFMWIGAALFAVFWLPGILIKLMRIPQNRAFKRNREKSRLKDSIARLEHECGIGYRSLNEDFDPNGIPK